MSGQQQLLYDRAAAEGNATTLLSTFEGTLDVMSSGRNQLARYP